MVIIEELKKFYLEASAKTYAGGMAKTTITDLPKSKVLRYERGDYLYVDCYFSSGTKSYGQTTIWLQGIPVWGMQYHGSWKGNDEGIIPFLKSALLSAYEKGEFRGGRGPEVFKNKEGYFTYRNFLDKEKNDFTEFEGEEWIQNIDGKVVFRHKYSGMIL